MARQIAPCPAGQDRAGLTAQLILGMPADQVVLRAADLVQHAGAGVGRAQLGQHRLGGLGLRVDLAVGLPARRAPPSGDIGPAVVQRLGPVPAPGKPCHRQQHRVGRGVGDLGPVRGALRAAGHGELHAGPDVTGVHLRVRLQDRAPPALGALHDRPVQRGRAAVPRGPGWTMKHGRADQMSAGIAVVSIGAMTRSGS